MYQLYIANKNYSSWSLRPWVLMRTLRIAFEERLVPFAGLPGSIDYRSFSPTGKVPCLVDGNTTVWDSLAITEYLAERHEGVWPREAQARAWARCAAAEMHSGFAALRSVCSMSCGVRVRLNEITPELGKDIVRLEALWKDGLSRSGGPFLAGAQFSAADAFFAPAAFRVQTYGLQLGTEATAYVERLLALDAMRAWMDAALKETWRDPGHEDDVLRVGVILEDLRASAGV